MSTMDFLDALDDIDERTPVGEFRPRAHYNASTDTLTLRLSDEPHVAERIDTLLTVLTAAGDPQRPVGFVLKNIRKHLVESKLGTSIFAGPASEIAVSKILLTALLAAEMLPGVPHVPLSRVAHYFDTVADQTVELDEDARALVGTA